MLQAATLALSRSMSAARRCCWFDMPPTLGAPRAARQRASLLRTDFCPALMIPYKEAAYKVVAILARARSPDW
jgi:hypothetical protein